MKRTICIAFCVHVGIRDSCLADRDVSHSGSDALASQRPDQGKGWPLRVSSVDGYTAHDPRVGAERNTTPRDLLYDDPGQAHGSIVIKSLLLHWPPAA